jgi:DNA (cytosine-5)-methyltransferase 1
MIGVELFSGAGGMSLGAEMAGVEIKLSVEIDIYAAATFKQNHKNAAVLNQDIRQIKNLDTKGKKNEPKILFGGPPCQGFSRSNHRTRNRINPNNWLFEEFIRVTKLWHPDWVVLENVEGILGTEQGLFIEKILESLGRIGYKTSHQILNAMNFGVPQNRERLFVVGSFHGEKFSFPKGNSSLVTVKEAIHDLPVLENGSNCYEAPYKKVQISSYAKKLRGNLTTAKNHQVSKNSDFVIERYKYIPQGGNWIDIPKRLMGTYTDSSRCHSGIYHRLDEKKPSVVIGNYRKNMLIHPKQDRGLSVREAARLQSFPDWFEFKGYLGNQQQQVGNAVPPLLAKAVFKNIV